MRTSILIAAIMLAAGAAEAQRVLLIPDSSSATGRRVMAFSPVDGSLINGNFINLPTGATTPKDAIQVNDQIWVSDQVADRIDRFSLTGSYISTIGGGTTGGLDNIRGMEFANNQVYVTNAGSANGAPGTNTVVRYSASGDLLGSFTTDESPFDVFSYNNELLVTSSATHQIDRYDAAGTFLGQFHAGAIRFPQQMTLKRSNNNVLVAGFSPPAGLYEYNAAGSQVAFSLSGLGLRGAFELDNGNILYTIATGVFLFNTSTGGTSQLISANAQYINEVVIPAPGAAVVLTFAGVLAFRRRR